MLIEGGLIKGRNLASKMGFPSLNVEYDGELNGVFVGEIFLDGQWRRAAVHLGPRPTINDPKPICEVSVLGWHGSVRPGTFLQVKILKKIRGIKKFDSLEQLKDQIASDVEFVKMAS